ncbi:MAG: TM2 domain-containing protein [Flavobacteriales bacterium]
MTEGRPAQGFSLLKAPLFRSVLVLLFVAMALVSKAGGPFRGRPHLDMQVLDSLQAEVWAIDTVGPPRGENPRLISSALAVLLGPFGAHRLYLGTTPKVAIIYGITFGGFGILAVVDLGHLLFTKDLDRYRNSDRVFMWSKAPEGITPP